MTARRFDVGLHGSYLGHRDGAELARQKWGCQARDVSPHSGASARRILEVTSRQGSIWTDRVAASMLVSPWQP